MKYIQNQNIINKIDIQIWFVASQGGTKITICCNKNSQEIKNYYKSRGFIITEDPISPLLLTISWSTR